MKPKSIAIDLPNDQPATKAFHPKSTATEAQQARVIEMLRTGLKSTFDFRKAGVMNPSMRINEINKKAEVCIQRVALRSVFDEDGFLHPRIAFYSLIPDIAEENRDV
jgi:hypothetical protein